MLIAGAALIQAAPAQSSADGYVGSEACARCHKTIYDNYRSTPMGRSLVPASDTSQLTPSRPITITSGALTYELTRRGKDLYQSESQKDIFSVTYKLEYSIGSGVNGITYAIRRGNYLFEAPLSYYARTKTWELSPGYENTSTGFSRTITEGCVDCHSGRPRAVAGSEGLYLDPPFAEMAIGCENCHGPGKQHAAHPSKNTIVNPARIAPRLASDICMNCHEAGDTRAYQPGKSNADFRPGTPLNHTVAVLKIPPSPADPSKDLLEHNFSMLLSRCYRASDGRMSCVTCHDPHGTPAKAGVPAYYEKKCLTCHTTSSCKLPAAARAREPGGCIACHMPKAEIGFIAHSALTNHRIVARPGDPLPDAAYQLTTPELPDLIYVNRTGDAPLSPLMLLDAYGELSDRDPRYRARYFGTLEKVSRDTDTPLVQAAVGMKAFKEGAPDSNRTAIAYLSKAIENGFGGPAAFETLATALANEGRTSEAITTLNRGIELSPWSPRLQKLLALQYIHAKQYDLAKQTLQRYLESFPEDQFVRDLLKKVGA
jgi:predicted CXXCH cytochrome family protein